jgi:hypothetical protein
MLMSRLPKSFRVASVVVATMAGAVGSRDAQATPPQSGWVMGGTQQPDTSKYQYFTAIATTFVVPSPIPNYFRHPISIWTGLESSGPVTVVQPVLIYDSLNEGNPQWYMENESFPGSMGTLVPVNPGDSILAEVWLDGNNPGSGCNPFNGSMCNYQSGWVDLTSKDANGNALTATSGDVLMPAPVTYAQGLILEVQGTSPYGDCSYYPYSTNVTSWSQLYTFSWTSLYTAVNTNFTLNLPGQNGWFNETTTDGSSAYTECGWGLGVAISGTEGAVIMNFSK